MSVEKTYSRDVPPRTGWDIDLMGLFCYQYFAPSEQEDVISVQYLLNETNLRKRKK
jgi:hypothetical protein